MRRLRTVMQAALGLALGLVVAGTAWAAPPTPLLWKLAKGHSTVYLLGSMHMLKDTDYPLSADVENAYHDAQKLVFEIPPAEMDSPATLALAMKYGVYMDAGHKLQDDIKPKEWEDVRAYVAKGGLSEFALQRFRPWMAAITIVEMESMKMGLKPDSGLDKHFMELAKADHKQTGGFETVDQQLSIFYTMTPAEQEDMLRQTLEELPDFQKEMNEQHDTWRRGDAAAMMAQAMKEFAKHPALYQKLVAQRNRNWIPQIEKLLAEPGKDTLVIVGALHLGGNDGVVHLLQQKGYKVERVCTGCTNIH